VENAALRLELGLGMAWPTENGTFQMENMQINIPSGYLTWYRWPFIDGLPFLKIGGFSMANC